MKKKNLKYLVLTMFFVAPFFTSSAQLNMIDEVSDAFQKGNASAIAYYLNDKVEFSIVGDKVGIYTKTQGASILQSFFAGNPALSFNVSHKGIKESSSFVIGSFTSSNNKKFRVYLLIKKVDNRSLICQLRIDQTNE